MLCSAVLLLAMTASPDLGSIQAEIERNWGDGKPARELRAKCQINVQVEIEDEALGDWYFPNMTSLSSGKTIHQTDWVEDIARKGDKHYFHFRFVPPDGVPNPGLTRTSAFNGNGSWVYTPEIQLANLHSGDDPTAQLTQDYFGDMIGFPGRPVAPTRTVAGDPKEVYQLDRLIPSGFYALSGEEAVEGEACVVLDRPGRDRVWLARDKGWAIARREWRWTEGGPLKRRIINRDFRPLAGGAWLPHSATMEIYGMPRTRPNQRVGMLRAKVLEAEANVPDLLFDPYFPDGTSVHDLGTGEMYLKGGLPKPARDQMLARLATYRPEFRPRPWYRSSWLLGLGAVALVVTAVVLWRRRSR
jgi:hypothetical protein